MDNAKDKKVISKPTAKEPCKHIPDLWNFGIGSDGRMPTKCKLCGVELVARWEEK